MTLDLRPVDLSGVGLPELLAVAAALETGRLRLPLTVMALSGLVEGPAARSTLVHLAVEGSSAIGVAAWLRCVAAERRNTQVEADRKELVWTGPEVPGCPSRDTAVVVRELFRKAQREVLIATFALDSGEKAAALFGELADRMDREPGLRVRMYVNIHRNKSTEPDTSLLRAFVEHFRLSLWPGRRLPEVYYDPRALLPQGGPRACLHAKCIVVDDTWAFVTSANFTEAAHGRNVEAGVVVEDHAFACQLRRQFEALVQADALVELIPSTSRTPAVRR